MFKPPYIIKLAGMIVSLCKTDFFNVESFSWALIIAQISAVKIKAELGNHMEITLFNIT